MSRLSRPAWLTTGLLIGAIAVPAVAAAATVSYVSITSNGRTATVTPDGQLRTTEMDPNYNLHKFFFVDSASGCTDLGALSATRTVVLKQLNAGLYALPSGFEHGNFELYATANCTGTPLATQTHSSFDTISSPLGSGVTLPAKTHVSVEPHTGTFEGDLYGYQAVAGAHTP